MVGDSGDSVVVGDSVAGDSVEVGDSVLAIVVSGSVVEGSVIAVEV